MLPETLLSQDTTASTCLMFYRNILSPRLAQLSLASPLRALHSSFGALIITYSYILACVFV